MFKEVYMKKNKLLLIAVMFFVSLFVITGCSSSDDIDNSKSKIYGLGETFQFDDLEITLGKDIAFTTLDNEFAEEYGKTVIKLPITVKNLKEETHSLNMFYYSVFGADGTQLNSLASYYDDSVDYAGDLRSGASYTKYLYFIYDKDGTYAIEFDDWTTQLTVEFEVKK